MTIRTVNGVTLTPIMIKRLAWLYRLGKGDLFGNEGRSNRALLKKGLAEQYDHHPCCQITDAGKRWFNAYCQVNMIVNEAQS